MAVKLTGFASLPADTFASGPPAGADISANGRTGPFDGQPVQGFSGVQFAPSSDGSYWFLSDNGFGSKNNSADYLLRIYQVNPNFRTDGEGDGTIEVEQFIQLSDPDNLIPFDIVNQDSTQRLLTGADFDIESFVIAQDGSIWVGDEFGPFLLHFDSTGKLIEAPIATPNVPNLETLNGQAPLVIGHRGASGSRPEHTLASYQLAISYGADYIEPDLVATKDGVLIARHENALAVVELDEQGNIVFDADGNHNVTSETTNVADLSKFAERLTVKEIDGVKIGGWFSEDFTLAEIKELRARERIPGVRPLNTAFNDEFEIPTFSEVIDLVKLVESETGNIIGIYPETKHPTYFAKEGTLIDGSPINISLSQQLIDTLVESEFTDPDRIFIQSFEIENLIELDNNIMPAAGVDIPLVQLTGDFSSDGGISVPYDVVYNFNSDNSDANPEVYAGFPITFDENTNYGDLANQEVINYISTYADGLGPWKNSFILRESLDTPVDGNGDGKAEITTQLTGEILPLVEWAHNAGLQVHPYTLRNEEQYLTLNPDGTPQTPEQEFEQLIELGVDGFFTDYPYTGDQVRDAVVAPVVRSPQNPDVLFDTLNGEAPLVIAHRGASGELPEHTLSGYRRAIAQGADYIEPDLVITSDGVLIARHEPILDDTTNVVEVFGEERQSTKVLDGEEVTAYFAEDFTLEEIKQLRAVQPRDFRDQSYNGEFEIPTFAEVIELVQQVEAETGVKVGIYPETKHPTFFDQQGLSLEEPLIATLLETGFTDPSRIFIQSFEVANLLDLQNNLLPDAGLEDLPLVQLYGDVEDDFINENGGGFSVPYDIVANFSNPEFDTADAEAVYGDLVNIVPDFGQDVNGDGIPDTTYQDLATKEVFDYIGETYAEGVGPWKNSFVLRESLDIPVDGNGNGDAEITTQLTGSVRPYVEWAHDAGMQIHPYTLRNEERYLTLNPDGTPQTPEAEFEQLIELGVDGFFTDFPETGRIAVNSEIVPPNLPSSRGFEGMAFSPDRTTLYPLLEGSVTGDPDDALRIYRFDATKSRYTHLVGYYQTSVVGHAIGDFTPINDSEFLVIERDGEQGEAAEFKKIFKVDISNIDQNGYVAKEEVVDLLNIDDPNDLNNDGETTFKFPFVTIEDVLVIDEKTILVANDNNYPFSTGRGDQIDNNEVILLELDKPLDLDPRLGRSAVQGDESKLVSGSSGEDSFIAGSNFDGDSNILFAGEGNDEIDLAFGGSKNRVDAGSGDDIIYVGSQNRVFGDAGNDEFEATQSMGGNRMSGGEGDDVFYLGKGDRALGDAGDDKFFVGSGGNNILSGGAGSDQFWIVNGEIAEAANTIVDFEMGVDAIGILGSASLGISADTITLNSDQLALTSYQSFYTLG